MLQKQTIGSWAETPKTTSQFHILIFEDAV